MTTTAVSSFGLRVYALGLTQNNSANGAEHMDATVNAQVIEALYQAYVTGDLAAFDAYTDDSVWDEAGHNQRSGVYRGKQAILEHAMQLAVLTDGTIATKVNEILPGAHYVAVIERATAKRKGGVLGYGLLLGLHNARGQDR